MIRYYIDSVYSKYPTEHIMISFAVRALEGEYRTEACYGSHYFELTYFDVNEAERLAYNLPKDLLSHCVYDTYELAYEKAKKQLLDSFTQVTELFDQIKPNVDKLV